MWHHVCAITHFVLLSLMCFCSRLFVSHQLQPRSKEPGLFFLNNILDPFSSQLNDRYLHIPLEGGAGCLYQLMGYWQSQILCLSFNSVRKKRV